MFHLTQNAQNPARRIVLPAVWLAGVSAVALLAAPAVSARPLGGGASVMAAPNIASDAAVAAAQQAAAIAKQSRSSLTRATQTIQALIAAQNAARNAAQNAAQSTTAPVGDGLATGGLNPYSGL